MAIVGSAYVIVHANTSAVRGEIERAFKDAKRSVQQAGDDLGKQFAQSFGGSLSDELANIMPEAMHQDVSESAQRTAADYADEFASQLGVEMQDTVATALADDSDAVHQQGQQDAGQYTSGFANSLAPHLEGLVGGLLGGAAVEEAGRDQGSSFGSTFLSAVEAVKPDIDVDIDVDRDRVEEEMSAAGSGAGRSFTRSFLGSLPSDSEIREASKALTQLIGIGNLVGPGLAQAVAGIAALVEGLFAIGAAASQAAPALVVLPSLYSALAQGALSVTVAFGGMKDAIGAALDPATKITPDMLKGLAPAAQDFVFALGDIAEEFADLRRIGQQALFPGLTQSIGILAQDLFPVLARVINDTNEAFSDLAVTASRRIDDPAALQNIESIASTNVGTIRTLGGAIIDLGDALTGALAAAGPLVDRFTSWVSSVESSVSAFLQVNAATGHLTDIFNQAGGTASQLLSIFGNLSGAVFDLGRAASPAGQSLLDSFEGVTEDLRSMTQEALASGEAFTRFGQIASNFRAIGDLARDLGGILIDIGSDDSVEQTFDALRAGVPAVQSIVQSFTDAGPALAELVVSAVNFIDAITQTNGITIFLETLTRIVDAITAIATAPGISQLITFFVPIIAVTRGIAFFLGTTQTILTGLVGRWALNAKAAGALGTRIGVLGTEFTAARTAGLGLTGAVTAGMTGLTAATTRAATATAGLATASEAAAVASARGRLVGTGLTAVAVPAATGAAVARTGAAAAAAAPKVGLLGKAMTGLRVASTAIIGVPLNPTFAAFAAGAVPVAGALAILKNRSDDYNESVEATATAIDQAQLAHSGETGEILKSSEAWKTYTAAVGEGNQNTELFKKAALGNEDAINAIHEELTGYNIEQGKYTVGAEEAKRLLMENGNAAQVLGTQLIDLKTKLEDVRAATNQDAIDAGFLSRQHQILSVRVEQSNQAFQQATDVMDSVVDRNLAARESTAQVNIALRNLDTSFKNLSTRNGRLTDQGFLDFTQTFRQMRDLSTQLASVGKTKAAEDALNGVREALRGMVQDGDLASGAYKKLVDQLNLTPDEVEVRVGIQGLQAAAGELAKLKKTRLELIAAGADENDAVILRLDADISDAQDKFDRLNHQFSDADPATLDVDADTSKARAKLDEFRRNRPSTSLEVDADLTKGQQKIQNLVNRAWSTLVDTDANTKPANDKISQIVERVWKTTIEAGGDTDEAVAKIMAVIRRRYSTSVEVNADTSAIASQIGAAVANLQATVFVNANVGTGATASATGRVFPGYAPWQDKILTLVSPGEAVLRPQAVRALGPDIINALNRDWNRVSKRLKGGWGGGIPRMATGGIIGTNLPTVSDFVSSLSQISTISRTGQDFRPNEAVVAGPTINEGDTWQITAAPGMSVEELAESISRKQAFQRRKGST